MYACTICGKTKESINNPEYDFRRPSTSPEERTVVGSSDLCSKCQQLSFFVNLEDSDDDDNDEKNAPDWVHQQTVEGTSTCDSQHAHPNRPPEVPVLQKRHYMRQKKAPLTTPTVCEKQQHPELEKKTSLTFFAHGASRVAESYGVAPQEA
ncbi:uncharacterized protein LOC117588462 [Drosophila guanche]|uniref:uncharacterized protein LOC117588462 n=1 Tax=Drosophila guanche TaxID=7266 RepID=UPI00147205BC|nr:uncharacterized protein LOC117588462 [Drosophila guanche]